MWFFKKKINIKSENKIDDRDINKLEEIKRMMHPSDTSIDKDLVDNPMNNDMSYKPLNNNFDNMKK